MPQHRFRTQCTGCAYRLRSEDTIGTQRGEFGSVKGSSSTVLSDVSSALHVCSVSRDCDMYYLHLYIHNIQENQLTSAAKNSQDSPIPSPHRVHIRGLDRVAIWTFGQTDAGCWKPNPEGIRPVHPVSFFVLSPVVRLLPVQRCHEREHRKRNMDIRLVTKAVAFVKFSGVAPITSVHFLCAFVPAVDNSVNVCSVCQMLPALSCQY